MNYVIPVRRAEFVIDAYFIPIIVKIVALIIVRITITI